MADKTKTDEKQETGAVAQTTGIDVAAGVQQDVTSDAAGNQDEVAGLKTAAEAERKKRQEAEAQTQLLREQMALQQANPVQQTTQPVSDYEQAKANIGLAGEEYIDETQRGAIFTEINRIINARSQQNAQATANQQFINTHPDYFDVVGKQVGNQMMPSAEITKILQEKPHLTAAAYASSQGAYQIVMDERKLQELMEKNIVNDEHLKQNDIDNKTSVVSGAAAGGGAITAHAGTATLEQQEEMEQRVANGEFNI